MTGGVLYAMTDEGERLPVIDVTNPAFAVVASEGEVAALTDRFLMESNERREIPAPLREALQRSRLGRAITAASGTFLTGMNTYLLKVGPDNLGASADATDRRIAASFPALMSRLRLQDVARLLADGLTTALDPRARRRLCLINIAGGPAADSWNALILLHARNPDLLPGREIVTAVLDLDERGPAFGARAFDVLRGPGAPLDGLGVAFGHVVYDWSVADRLPQALDALRAADAACAVSSEGGLFEYGSDADIVRNLEALRSGTARDTIVVGSVTREGEPMRASRTASGVSTRPRTLDAFGCLAERAGWLLHGVIDRPFSYNVRLVRLDHHAG
jgi:hypothetical protein